MLSQYESPDTNNTQDLFDIGTDFSDTLDNTQSQSHQVSTSSTVPLSSSSPILIQQPTNNYQQQQQQQQVQTQPRLTYLPATRAQLASYQTPNLQRIQTMPSTATNIRPTHVISNGIQQQQQTTIYTQQPQQQVQQMINPAGGPNRPLFQRMSTGTQPATLIRQQYNSTGMINMNQNVPQMSIVKVRTRQS